MTFFFLSCMPTQNILIIGATSGMAEAVARRYAADACNFMLVGRDQGKLDVVAADLVARGAATVHTQVWEARDMVGIPHMTESAWRVLKRVDVAVIAHGTLPDQARVESDLAYALDHFRLNGESALACMLGLATHFETQGQGVMAVIGSVAGDRGRGSNYLYGAAKSAVEACASGLRARLFKINVHVLLIKPGFVATAMTARLKLPAKLTVSADHVAKDIVRAVAARKNVLYTPWFWSLIMLVIRHMPDFAFNRLKL